MSLKHYIVVIISFALGFTMGWHPSFEAVRGFIINGLPLGLVLVFLGVVINMVGLLQQWYKQKQEERRNHTNALKEVIKQWKKEIPTISTNKLNSLGFGILTGYKEGINPFFNHFVQGTFGHHEMKVTIEDKYIFKDLLFHLEKREPQIAIAWNEYKKKCVDQYKIGNKFITEMAKEFTEQIEKKCGIGHFKITKYGTELNSISERYLNAIFYTCIICAEGDIEEFSKFYENFESHTGYKNNTIGYSIVDLDTGYITIEKGLLEENDFKTKIDDVMTWMFEKAKIDYNPKGKKLVDLIAEINKLEKEIKELLDDQLNYQEFKGKCKYL